MTQEDKNEIKHNISTVYLIKIYDNDKRRNRYSTD
jgi:hypothetical protein